MSRPVKGRSIIQASWAGTAVFAATALPAASGVDGAGYVNVVVSLVLFGVSIPVSLVALGRAAVRAGAGERITVTGLFFLSGSAPTPVRLHLLGSLVVALVVTAVSASAEPFGVLVPVYQLSLAGLWAALHGSFPQIPQRAG